MSRACMQILIKPLAEHRSGAYFWSTPLEGKFSRGNYLFSWLDSDRIRAEYRHMCVYKPRVRIGAADNAGTLWREFARWELMMVRTRWKDRNCLWLKIFHGSRHCLCKITTYVSNKILREKKNVDEILITRCKIQFSDFTDISFVMFVRFMRFHLY